MVGHHPVDFLGHRPVERAQAGFEMRYRRLDMACNRTKTEASIAISRGKDE